MSALDGWIDVCCAGTWRDMGGREVALDEARLDRIIAAHAAADPAPVVVGHPKTDARAFAWVSGLRRTGDRLQAQLRDIAAPFREVVEAGRYAGRSIALQGDTLRHVGFLGGRAPAVSYYRAPLAILLPRAYGATPAGHDPHPVSTSIISRQWSLGPHSSAWLSARTCTRS